MARRDLKNLVAGGFLIAIGVAFAGVARTYGLGSIAQMGPGFYPFVAGLILCGLGLLVAVPAFFRSGTWPLRPDWRSLLLNAGGVLAFAVLIRPLGLIPAVLATAIITATADTTSRVASTLALAIGLTVGIWLMFRVALGITIPAFGSVF